MKNVIRILIAITTLTMLQACEQLAGMDEASKQAALVGQCSPVYGCPFFLDAEKLKTEVCMQDLVKEAIDYGMDCSAIETEGQTTAIKCLYLPNTTQDEVTKEIEPMVNIIRDRNVQDYGWYYRSNGTPWVRLGIYHSAYVGKANGGTYSSVGGGTFVENEELIRIDIADPDNIVVKDCQ